MNNTSSAAVMCKPSGLLDSPYNLVSDRADFPIDNILGVQS